MSKLTESDVLETIRSALGTDGAQVTMDTMASDIESWDSLGHLTILAWLDEKFEGGISGIDALATADSVKHIVQILKENELV